MWVVAVLAAEAFFANVDCSHFSLNYRRLNLLLANILKWNKED